jgi:hypothetical protein
MFRRTLYRSGFLWSVVFILDAMAWSAAVAQVTLPTPVFGFVRATLNGSGTQGGVTLVGPSFVDKVVQEAGLQAGAPKPYELTAPGMNWAANAFATHPQASSHFVEVKSSSNLSAIGLMSDIIKNSSNTLTIADDFSALLRGGESIVIRPHKTLGALFGPENEAGLGGGDAGSADVVSVLSEGPQASFTSYYYRSGSPLGGTGWRTSSNPFADQSNVPLKTGHGLIVKRRQAQPLEVVLRGYVRTGIWRRTLPTGFSLVDPLAPITDQSASQPVQGFPFTLGGASGSGVIPSGLGSTLTAGTPQTADLVSLAGTVASFYLASSSGLSSGGWRRTSNPFVDQQATVIPPASAILVQNRGAAKRWSRPQPFVVTTP